MRIKGKERLCKMLWEGEVSLESVKEKLYCTVLNRQGRLNLKLLLQGRETGLDSTETKGERDFKP